MPYPRPNTGLLYVMRNAARRMDDLAKARLPPELASNAGDLRYALPLATLQIKRHSMSSTSGQRDKRLQRGMLDRMNVPISISGILGGVDLLWTKGLQPGKTFFVSLAGNHRLSISLGRKAWLLATSQVSKSLAAFNAHASAKLQA